MAGTFWQGPGELFSLLCWRCFCSALIRSVTSFRHQRPRLRLLRRVFRNRDVLRPGTSHDDFRSSPPRPCRPMSIQRYLPVRGIIPDIIRRCLLFRRHQPGGRQAGTSCLSMKRRGRCSSAAPYLFRPCPLFRKRDSRWIRVVCVDLHRHSHHRRDHPRCEQ